MVVANIQVRTLKVEVEKGSMRTAVGHGLINPKRVSNFKKWAIGRGNPSIKVVLSAKGKQVKIPAFGFRIGGNAK